MGSSTLTYRKSGVNIDLADKLVDHIQSKAPAIGGFAGLFPLDLDGDGPWELVACTDGVGTKLKLAFALDKHDTIGIDLVAMSVNDLVCCGAKPLIFLDYYATGKLNVEIAAKVIAGIVEGCVQAGAALVGGETAEMPGMYSGEDYDLAGFCVGIVERDRIIDGAATRTGDVLIGLPSTGPHANGYSLIRKLISSTGANARTELAGRSLYDRLLAPTRIYVKALLALIDAVPVKGLAHITGGGLLDNIPRAVPDGLHVVLERAAWPRDPIFEWLQGAGRMADGEMHRTFNCGIGMTVCVAPGDAARALEVLAAQGAPGVLIGEVRSGAGEVVIH